MQLQNFLSWVQREGLSTAKYNLKSICFQVHHIQKGIFLMWDLYEQDLRQTPNYENKHIPKRVKKKKEIKKEICYWVCVWAHKAHSHINYQRSPGSQINTLKKDTTVALCRANLISSPPLSLNLAGEGSLASTLWAPPSLAYCYLVSQVDFFDEVPFKHSSAAFASLH